MEEAHASWLPWKNIDEPAGHIGHAVYKVRLVSRQSGIVAINRFLGTDKKGILCIGMTTNMERRRKEFKSGKEGKPIHSGGYLLSLLKDYSHFNAEHRNSKYEYRFQKTENKVDAKFKESRHIKKYVKRYGEVPPLNSAIPNKDDKEGWDC
jgi:predicted GIY-YIG superfamily endonuclease